MRIEVINTGSELLLGQVLNTHLCYFAEALFPLGLRIATQITVPDGDPIRFAIAETFGRADVVLVTGGLGPTTDDITREIVAELLGVDLVHDPEIMRSIEERFASRGFRLTERIGRQAMRPREATILMNRHGTAPGMYLPPREASPHLFLLPGPPRELKPMFEGEVLPLLRALSPGGATVGMRNFRITGVGESLVEERVGAELLASGVELGYCARPGEVDVRVIGTPEQLGAAEALIGREFARQLVSQDSRSLEKVVVDLLTARGETLCTAESCTGGAVAHALTNVPGASAIFHGGFVTYANESKVRQLGVPGELIERLGAVSAEVAQAMAEGARAATGADHALATTGIAGPGGGTPEKPVGLVFIALASRLGATVVEKRKFPTDRGTFKDLVVQNALDLLRRSVGAA